MIYNTRNRNNDTTESQKEKKTCFDAHAGGKWNLTIQCILSKQNSVLIILEMASLDTLFLCSAGEQAWFCS